MQSLIFEFWLDKIDLNSTKRARVSALCVQKVIRRKLFEKFFTPYLLLVFYPIIFNYFVIRAVSELLFQCVVVREEL